MLAQGFCGLSKILNLTRLVVFFIRPLAIFIQGTIYKPPPSKSKTPKLLLSYEFYAVHLKTSNLPFSTYILILLDAKIIQENIFI